MSDAPLVTVLIPARNEEADIECCLRAVLAQDHPHGRIEIVLVDGGSNDATAEVARQVLEAGDVAWKILDNPAGSTPTNLNVGLAAAKGEYLCRVDARSLIPSDYVRRCAGLLSEREDVVVTGGAQVAVARGDGTVERGIARALNNRYAMGGSRYRSGAESGPTDTVYLGSFRTQQLREVGGWEPFFETNQDFELNRRMARSGTVWFDSRLAVSYIPRRSIAKLMSQYHRFGRWKVRYWRRSGALPEPRQVLILAVALSASVTAALFIGRGFRRRRVAETASYLALSTTVALLIVDAMGSGERAPWRVRGTAMVANAAVGGAWVLGIGREALARRHGAV